MSHQKCHTFITLKNLGQLALQTESCRIVGQRLLKPTKLRLSQDNLDKWDPNVQGASVNRAILQHCFFWFGNTGADAAIAILPPTLKRFTCNRAVDWSTTRFCCERVLQNW